MEWRRRRRTAGCLALSASPAPPSGGTRNFLDRGRRREARPGRAVAPPWATRCKGPMPMGLVRPRTPIRNPFGAGGSRGSRLPHHGHTVEMIGDTEKRKAVRIRQGNAERRPCFPCEQTPPRPVARCTRFPALVIQTTGDEDGRSKFPTRDVSPPQGCRAAGPQPPSPKAQSRIGASHIPAPHSAPPAPPAPPCQNRYSRPYRVYLPDRAARAADACRAPMYGRRGQAHALLAIACYPASGYPKPTCRTVCIVRAPVTR